MIILKAITAQNHETLLSSHYVNNGLAIMIKGLYSSDITLIESCDKQLSQSIFVRRN